VAYQGRKKRKTTNSIYLTDRQGIPLAMSIPVSGNHNDLYAIDESITEIVKVVGQADISVEGLFVNADGGFDGEHLFHVFEKEEMIPNIPENRRNSKFDYDRFFHKKLYEERYSIERTNAWIDSFRSCLNRFDVKTSSWIGFNYLAFIVIGLRKFTKSKKSR